MDCDYICLNDNICVHPAFRQQDQSVTVSIIRETNLEDRRNEHRCQSLSQSLCLQISGEHDRQTKDDIVDYNRLLTYRDYHSLLTPPKGLEISNQKTTESKILLEKPVESEIVQHNSKEGIFYDGIEEQNGLNTSCNDSLIFCCNFKESEITEMSFQKTTYETMHCQSTPMNNDTHVFIPSLDLTSLTMEDETETRPKPEANKSISKDDRQQTSTAPQAGGGGGGAGGGILFRKQKMPFVFPSEKSFQDIDVMRGNPNMSQFDDQYYITSVSSYRTNSGVNEPALGKEQEMCFDDGTISFSLSNPKLGKYIVEGDASKLQRKDVVNNNNVIIGHNNNDNKNYTEKVKSNKSSISSSGNTKNNSSSNTHGAIENREVLNSGQQVYDVIIVNGNLNHNDNDVFEKDEEEEPRTEMNNEGDKSLCKPKSRVTFSFPDSDTASGRYTPIKGDVRVQLQSVLKKRRTPSPVLQRSSSEDRIGSRKKRAQIVNKDSVRLFGSSYTLDYRFGYQNNGVTVEHGIPVTNVHTTSTDLEKRHNKQATATATTNMADKPPVPSTANRITLSMAERAATSGSVRGMPNRESRLSASHMRGRMAYFRPAEKARSSPNQTTRSRSSDDLYSLHSRSNNNQNSSTGKNKNTTTLPFSLRRCASSERDILVADGSNRSHHRPKPKVAFGSFILPKETSTRIKPAQVQFHELNTPQGNLPLGTYVHSHTRRSPYAPPTQVLLSDNRNQEVLSRRPGTGNNQARYLHKHHHQQQQQQQQQRQAPSSTRNHAHRHSAPSSYGSVNVKDKSLASSNNDRISVNTPPTKSHFPRQTGSSKEPAASTFKHHDVTPASNKPIPSSHTTSNGSKTVKYDHGRLGAGANSEFVTTRKPNISHLNTIATRERGASHHRFISTLESFTNGGS